MYEKYAFFRAEMKQQYIQSDIAKDYELVRQEMTNLKDCITNYMGFVLGGAAVTIYGLIYEGLAKGHFMEVAYMSLIVSVILSFILLILFYKFHSHNRYAGYCKLLNSELIPQNQKNCWISWELCVDRVRQSEYNKQELNDLLKGVNLIIDNKTGSDAQNYISDITEKINSRTKYYLHLRRNLKTKSWRFPPLVTIIILTLSSIFLIIEAYSLYQLGFSNYVSYRLKILWFSAGIVSIIQITLWMHSFSKLHALLTGPDTIDSYFWRFLPYRAKFLNELGIIPKYFSH
jgi:hypothetical protein